MRKSNFQAPVERWLVGDGNQVLPSGGSIVGSGTSLNIADDQLGVISATHSGTVAYGTFIPQSTTAVDVDKIKVVQGTPNSSKTYNVNPFGVGDKAYVESHTLEAGKILSVSTVRYTPASYNIFRIKSLSGTAASTRYKMSLTMESVKGDIVNNMNRENLTAVVTTPSSATSLSDYVLQELALNLNKQSAIVAQASPTNFAGNKPFVILGVNIGGSSGTVIGTLKEGDSFNFAQYTVGATTYTASYTADKAFIAGLNKAITADSSLSTARIVTLGSVASGSATTVNALLVVAFDEQTALAFDDIQESKVKIQACGINGTGLTYTGGEVAEAFEGYNTGRQVYLRYKKRADLQIFTMQNHPVHGEYWIQPTNYLSELEEGYTVTVIDHYDDVENLNNTSNHPKKTVIVLTASITNPTANADTGYTTATDDSTTVSHLNLTLGAWLSNASDNFKKIEYLGAASKAAPFV